MDKQLFEKELKTKLKFRKRFTPNKENYWFEKTINYKIFNKVKCYVEDQTWFDGKYLVFFELENKQICETFRINNIKRLQEII